jgi:hypothetical protein
MSLESIVEHREFSNQRPSCAMMLASTVYIETEACWPCVKSVPRTILVYLVRELECFQCLRQDLLTGSSSIQSKKM